MESVEVLNRAIELDPMNEEAWTYKASVLDTRLNKSAEALLAYDKAIEQCPLDAMKPMGAETWYKKGIALQALGHTSEADAAFAKAKELGYQA